MPKVVAKRRTLKILVFTFHPVVGWDVKPLTPAEKKAKTKARDERRDAAKAKREQETDLLNTVAKASRGEAATPAQGKWTEPAQAETARRVWGHSEPAPAARRTRRTCGQITEDGSPCERPWSANGCGVDHAKPTKAMQARTKVASRGVPTKKTAARKTAAKPRGGSK